MKMGEKYIKMKEVSHKDYLEFIKDKTSVIIEDVEIKLQKNWNIELEHKILCSI